MLASDSWKASGAAPRGPRRRRATTAACGTWSRCTCRTTPTPTAASPTRRAAGPAASRCTRRAPPRRGRRRRTPCGRRARRRRRARRGRRWAARARAPTARSASPRAACRCGARRRPTPRCARARSGTRGSFRKIPAHSVSARARRTDVLVACRVGPHLACHYVDRKFCFPVVSFSFGLL